MEISNYTNFPKILSLYNLERWPRPKSIDLRKLRCFLPISSGQRSKNKPEKCFPWSSPYLWFAERKKVKSFRRGNEEGYFLHLTHHNPILPGFWEHLFPQPKPYFTIDIKYLFCALVQAMKLMHQFSMTRAHTRTERPLSNVDILKKKHG